MTKTKSAIKPLEVPPPAQPAKPVKPEPAKIPIRWGSSAAKFYADLEGETIRVHLHTGETLVGVLVGVDTYDIFLEREAGARAMVSKHAIDYVEPGS